MQYYVSFIWFLLSFLGHPLSAIFPNAASDKNIVQKEIYSVCPRNNCNALYLLPSKNVHCINLLYGKICGEKYECNLAGKRKCWKPFKTFQYIKVSQWLKQMFLSVDFNHPIQHWKSIPESKHINDVKGSLKITI